MKFEWKLKDILMIGIAGVLFSFLFLGTTYLGGALTALLAPLGLGGDMGYEPFYGIYFMAAAFAVYVIRKPGVGIVAEILASLLEVLMGNYFGPMVIVTGLIQGVGIEVAFAATKYKKYNMSVMLLSAVTCTCISFFYHIFRSQFYLLNVGLVLAMFVVRLVSALLFSGVLTKVLADSLAKAGVLKSYEIGKAYTGAFVEKQ